MSVLEEFISIQASPSQIEQYLTEQDLVNTWVSPLIEMELVEGSWMTVGSVYRLHLKTLFLWPLVTYKLVERDSSHLRFEFEGIWQGSELWHWFADGPRTIVQNRIDYELTNPIVRALLSLFAVLFVQLDMRVQMVQLQRLVEGQSHVVGKLSSPPQAEKKESRK